MNSSYPVLPSSAWDDSSAGIASPRADVANDVKSDTRDRRAAPPSSYLFNLEAAGEVGLDAELVRGVLAAVAPTVGTARVASATGRIVKALSFAIEIAEEDAQYGRVAAVSGRFRRNLRADPSGVAGRPLVSTVGGWSR